MRGAWIEIRKVWYNIITKGQSHPVRGAWIEISNTSNNTELYQSHPVRGAWIEIISNAAIWSSVTVAPREGCVD